MIGKFIGVDLDGAKVRLCVIKRGFRKTELIRFIEIDIPDDGQSITNLISHHLEKESVKTDIAVSIPSSPVSMRILSFPFRDVKKIDQVYDFELENASTLQTDDMINSYHLVNNQGGGADALVCMFKKEEIADTLSIFEEGEISPRVLTYSPFALDALQDQLKAERPFVLLSIGQVATNFTLFDKNGLSRVRSSSAGLESIVNKYSELSGADKDSSKQRVLSGLSNSDDKVLRQAFSFLFSEIKKTLKFFEFDSKSVIEKVLLAGDAAAIPSIIDYLKRDINKDISIVSVADLGEQKSAVYLNSYALALYGSENGGGKLNFRKDEYKFTSKDEETRRALVLPAILLCSLFLLILIRNGINYIRVNNQVKKLDAQIESSVKQLFPEVKALPRPVDYMENQVKRVRGELDLISGIRSGKTPLDIMRNLSTIIPTSSSVTFDELYFTGDLSLRLRGRSKSYDDIAKVERALNDSSFFEKVVRSSAGSALDKIKFEISLVIK